MTDVEFAIENIKRVRYHIEVSGAYATNQSGSVTYKDIRTTSAELTLTQEFLENATMQQLLDATQPKIRSRRRCDMSVGSYLASHNTIVSGATLPVTSAHSDIIGTMMGGIYYTSGSEVASAIDAGQFAEASVFDKFAGTAVGLVDPTSGRLEVSRVKATGALNLTLEHDLPFTPAVGAPIYGGASCYFTDDPQESLQFYSVGQDNQDTWVLMGLQGNFSMAFANGELVTINYDLAGGANWNSGSADDLGEANFLTSDPLPVVDSRVMFYPAGAAGVSPDYICIDANAWEITPNLNYIDITTPKGVNNILRKRRSRSVPVAAGSVTAYFHDVSYFVDRDTDVRYGMAIQVGSTPGATVYISAPLVQLTDVARVDASEHAGVQISFEVLDNKRSTITSGNRELARSAFSVHFL